MDNGQATPLRRIRKAAGFTQAQVADALGVSKATYSSWETGRAELGAKRLVALADLFECTPDDILGYRQPDARYASLSIDEEEVVKLWRTNPRHMQKAVLDILRTTSKQSRM